MNWWESDPVATMDPPQEEWWKSDPIAQEEPIAEPIEQPYTGPKFSDPVADPWAGVKERPAGDFVRGYENTLANAENLPDWLSGLPKPSEYDQVQVLQKQLEVVSQGEPEISPRREAAQKALDAEYRRLHKLEGQAKLAKERYDTFAAENKDSAGVMKEREIRRVAGERYKQQLALEPGLLPGESLPHITKKEIEDEVRMEWEDLTNQDVADVVLGGKYARKKYDERLVEENPTSQVNMASRVVHDTIFGVGANILAAYKKLTGDEAGAHGYLQKIRDLDEARRVGQGAVPEFVEDVAGTLATTAAVAPLGGYPALAAYYGITSANEAYDRTGELPYALTEGVIQGGMTLVGGKYLSAGLGQMANKIGGKAVNNAMSKAVAQALKRAGAPTWMRVLSPAIVGAGGEVAEEDATDLLSMLNDYTLNGNPDAFKGMMGRLAYTSGVALASGGAGGGVNSGFRGLAINKRRSIAEGMMRAADEMKSGLKGVEAAVADIEKRSIVRQDNAEQSGDDNSLLDNSLQNVRQQDAEQPIPVPLPPATALEKPRATIARVKRSGAATSTR
jgi:hypothetical protein